MVIFEQFESVSKHTDKREMIRTANKQKETGLSIVLVWFDDNITHSFGGTGRVQMFRRRLMTTNTFIWSYDYNSSLLNDYFRC